MISFLNYPFYISFSFREFFHWDSLPSEDNRIFILKRSEYLVMLLYYKLPITFTTRYDSVRRYLKDSQGLTNSPLCPLCERVILFALNKVRLDTPGSTGLPFVACSCSCMRKLKWPETDSASNLVEVMWYSWQNQNLLIFFCFVYINMVLVDSSFYGFPMFYYSPFFCKNKCFKEK